VRVSDPDGLPIGEAVVNAVGPWGADARQRGLDGVVTDVLSPVAKTDVYGQATLRVSSEYDYYISAARQDFAPTVMILPDNASAIDLSLAPIFVAGIQVLDDAADKIITYQRERWDGKYWHNPDYRRALDEREKEIRDRFGLSDIRLFFAVGGKDHPLPESEVIVISGYQQTKEITAPLRRLAEFAESDIQKVWFENKIVDYSSVIVRFRDEDGNPVNATGCWTLQKLKAFAASRSVSELGDELEWSGLEPGTWYLIRRCPKFELARGLNSRRNAYEIQVLPGSRQVIDYVVPRVEAASVNLRVIDQCQREVSVYGASLRYKKLGWLVLRELGLAVAREDVFPPGECTLIVNAPGYEDLQKDVLLQNGENDLIVKVSLLPKGGMKKAPW
jgi:hypothetical protein